MSEPFDIPHRHWDLSSRRTFRSVAFDDGKELLALRFFEHTTCSRGNEATRGLLLEVSLGNIDPLMYDQGPEREFLELISPVFSSTARLDDGDPRFPAFIGADGFQHAARRLRPFGDHDLEDDRYVLLERLRELIDDGETLSPLWPRERDGSGVNLPDGSTAEDNIKPRTQDEIDRANSVETIPPGQHQGLSAADIRTLWQPASAVGRLTMQDLRNLQNQPPEDP